MINPFDYRPITIDEAEASRQAILQPMMIFRKQCLERYQRDIDPGFGQSHYDGMCGLLDIATIVFWRADIWVVAAGGRTKFIGEKPNSQKINPKIQLWVPDRDFNMPPAAIEKLKLGPSNVLSAILVVGNLRELRFSKDRLKNEIPENTLAIASFFVPSNDNYKMWQEGGSVAIASELQPEELAPTFRINRMDGDQDVNDEQGAGLLAMIDFMNQEYVSLQRHLPSRQVRRQAERKNQRLADVRYVILRRAHHEAHVGNGKAREWNCSWLVSGHWRNQWYPSEAVHHPKFIPEYVKGDLEKPLRPKLRTVYKVVR